ncbi:MAG: ABC-2 transporter permease [Lachnospiraceae bacterium]|nr:ABC-2 transporter permease [Lachnospiraceae bacterium]
MKGLLIKDLCSISNYKKQYALILAFICVWSILSKSFSFLAMYSILLGGMMVLSVMSMDEAVHFNRYALTMPISVKTLVKEKYVLVCICIGAGSLLALIVEVIAMSTPWYEGTIEWVVINCISAFFLIAYTITLPIIFKYGVEKARYVYMAVMLVMGGAIGISVYLTRNTAVMLFDGIPHPMDNLLLTGGLWILDAIVIVISCQVSLKVVRDKEW